MVHHCANLVRPVNEETASLVSVRPFTYFHYHLSHHCVRCSQLFRPSQKQKLADGGQEGSSTSSTSCRILLRFPRPDFSNAIRVHCCSSSLSPKRQLLRSSHPSSSIIDGRRARKAKSTPTSTPYSCGFSRYIGQPHTNLHSL